jgi:hypothetical protein
MRIPLEMPPLIPPALLDATLLFLTVVSKEHQVATTSVPVEVATLTRYNTWEIYHINVHQQSKSPGLRLTLCLL